MSEQEAQPINNSDATPEHDPDYKPLVQLTEVETKTHEEDEAIFFKLRAKLFRFDKTSSEWKERGTGEVKLLQNNDTKKIRLVMRRDKTLKVCANHYINSDMVLAPNVGSDRSWVYNAAADMGDEGVTAETLAIRFGNSDNANAFKAKFEEAQQINAGLAKENSEKKESAVEKADEEKKESKEADEKATVVQSDATADAVATTETTTATETTNAKNTSSDQSQPKDAAVTTEETKN